MSIMQRLTLIGLYNYDNKLFDGLSLPEQYDKNTFIDTLLIEHGEKLVLYSDYDFMKYSIGAWGRKWSLELTRIAEALFAEYNPIWNYDRYEEWTDKGDSRGTSETGASHNEKTVGNTSHSEENAASGSHIEQSNSNSNSDQETETETSRRNLSEANNTSASETSADATHRLQNNPDYKEEKTTENVTNGETEHKVSADNDSDYQPASKDITNIGKNKVTTTADGLKDDISEINHNEGNTNENSTVKTEESGIDNTKTSTSGGENSNSNSSGRNETTASAQSASTSDTSTVGGSNTKTTDAQINTSDHIGHIWGNVGVTTSTKMVDEVILQRMNM